MTSIAAAGAAGIIFITLAAVMQRGVQVVYARLTESQAKPAQSAKYSHRFLRR